MRLVMNFFRRNKLLAPLLFWIGVPGVVIAQTSNARPNSGLLLGIRGDGYYTVWITNSPESEGIVRIPGVLVPRDHGFSWIGLYFTAELSSEERYITGEKQGTVEEHLWIQASDKVSPNPIKGRITANEVDEYCATNVTRIAYVGPKYLSLQQSYANPCGQNAAVYVTYTTWTLDDSGRSDASVHALSNADLFDSESQKALVRDRDAALDDDCPPQGELGAPMWTLLHQKGAWTLQGWQETIMACGGGNDYDIHANPPATLVGRNKLVLPWQQVQSKVPGAIDAVSSPRGDLLVVMTAEQLLVFPVRAGTIGSALQKWPFPDAQEHTIVMEQWAQGRYVSIWDQEVQLQKQLHKSDDPFEDRLKAATGKASGH